MPQHIVVVEYDPEWKQMYDIEASVIKQILGTELVEIYHIGSTSVTGLKAKPIIDIMAVVKDIARVDLLNGEFEKIGYECMGEFGILGRRYLRKGGDERTHQVHIFGESNKKDIERHLAVRDYLRTHDEAAKKYGELKSRLALLFPDDSDGYSDGKEDFVKQMEREALFWHRQKK
jgi:GrpB-like predicted nucleotidyltransferase (UPF0157 family)